MRKTRKDTKDSITLHLSSAYLNDREKVWAAVRQLKGPFTRAALQKASGVYSSVSKDYLECLVRGGYVSQTPPQCFTVTKYTMIRDCGANAPRLRKNGTELLPTGRTRMWQAMAVLSMFTLEELVNTASLPEAEISTGEAEHYCNWLVRGGYLYKNGAVYTAIPAMRHGPKAPQILRVKQLFDPNTGEIRAAQILHREEAL